MKNGAKRAAPAATIARMPSSRRGDFHGLIASDPPAACNRIRGPDASCGDDLTWVHDRFGIERLFDATHQIEAGTKLVAEELHLAPTYAMLAGACAIHGDRPHDQPLVEPLDPRHLVLVLAVAEQDDVEIAVTDMADDRAIETGSGEIGLGRDDAFGEPRDGNADIGREDLLAGSHCL